MTARHRASLQVPLLVLSLVLPSVPGFAISVELIPTLPLVITNVNLGDYDILGKGLGPQMYVVNVNNVGQMRETGITLRYRVVLNQGSANEQKLFEGISNKDTVGAGENLSETSNEFAKADNPSVRFSLYYTVFELADLQLKQKIADSQRLPDGTLTYTMVLEKNGAKLGESSFECKIMNASKVELVRPGMPADGGAPYIIFEPYPVFTWTSDLPPNVYAKTGEDAFEVRLYQAKSGEGSAEALSRAPIHRGRTSQLQYMYPTSAPQLLPGVLYCWEVAGYLRGASTTEIRSNVFSFRMAKVVNLKVMDIINALRPVVDEQTLQQIYDYDTDATIRINGRIVGITELRALVSKILAGEHDVIMNAVY